MMMQPAAEWSGVDIEACYAYTLGRQTRHGGFCYYAYVPWGVEEPNALDTNAALAILDLLKRPVPRSEDCADWLLAVQDELGGYSSMLIGWSTLKALRLLGLVPSRDPHGYLRNAAERLLQVTRASHGLAGWLTNALRCFDLWMDFGLRPGNRERQGLAGALATLRSDDGGCGAPGANLPETAMAATLAAIMDLPTEAPGLSYARRCERPPYGFNITPTATSSSLECQHAGLRVLRAFGTWPTDPALIRGYVRACQTDAGGFGRVPRAIPRLDDSLRALECLSLLADAGQTSAQTVGRPDDRLICQSANTPIPGPLGEAVRGMKTRFVAGSVQFGAAGTFPSIQHR